MQKDINIQKGFSEVYKVLVVNDPSIIKLPCLEPGLGVRLRHWRSWSGVEGQRQRPGLGVQ